MSFGGDSANAFVMHGEKGPENIMRIDAKKDLGIRVSSNLSPLHHGKSAQKAFGILRMIRRTFSLGDPDGYEWFHSRDGEHLEQLFPKFEA
ncbi:hypothetical protein T265_01859 [Opisthorchis viverrini]|uniref:Uncharacterized protein n=1 Tax=Opisthorchis viverrini TaxID=6198 RepID=A0A074ZXV2_OPIVI|nr:hypothetical protein T265_01859 [Opisthorchis viverrini]KER31921.1 hypothetical protein T265_01859 [Opisthorchis viverrini]